MFIFFAGLLLFFFFSFLYDKPKINFNLISNKSSDQQLGQKFLLFFFSLFCFELTVLKTI